MRVFSFILSLLFPEECLGCHTKGSLLCKNCLYSLPRAVEVRPDTVSVFEYRNTIMKDLMWKLKYSHAKRITEILSPILFETLFDEIQERQLEENFYDPVFVAIPISTKRMRGRGYNQSVAIIQSLLIHDKERIFSFAKDVLVKTKDTIPQARIKNRSERLGNLKNVFAIDQTKKHLIKGRNVIIVDDITTTGGTLDEARRALRKAGARRILGFTIAH